MIAYNHFIDFIPKLENEKSTAGFFSHILTVKESPFFEMKKKMKYKIKFFNNQSRDIALYSQQAFSSRENGQLWSFEVEEVASFFPKDNF